MEKHWPQLFLYYKYQYLNQTRFVSRVCPSWSSTYVSSGFRRRPQRKVATNYHLKYGNATLTNFEGRFITLNNKCLIALIHIYYHINLFELKPTIAKNFNDNINLSLCFSVFVWVCNKRIYNSCSSCLFYEHGLTLVPAWTSNYTHYKMWDEITYPFPNFNGWTVYVVGMYK